jgi:hypothetical protein
VSGDGLMVRELSKDDGNRLLRTVGSVVRWRRAEMVRRLLGVWMWNCPRMAMNGPRNVLEKRTHLWRSPPGCSVCPGCPRSWGRLR